MEEQIKALRALTDLILEIDMLIAKTDICLLFPHTNENKNMLLDGRYQLQQRREETFKLLESIKFE